MKTNIWVVDQVYVRNKHPIKNSFVGIISKQSNMNKDPGTLNNQKSMEN